MAFYLFGIVIKLLLNESEAMLLYLLWLICISSQKLNNYFYYCIKANIMYTFKCIFFAPITWIIY